MYRQPTLFGGTAPERTLEFSRLQRRRLDVRAWVDFASDWLSGADDLYDQLAADLPWRAKVVTMYGRRLPEPRLSTWWSCRDGPAPAPELDEVRVALSARYEVEFDTIGFNWYRHGADSVAWHADTKGPPIVDPTIAIVGVGSRRPFRLRPKGGGPSVTFESGGGDLLVMGGACQQRWEHTVPKVARGGPRISITYRHGGNH